VDARTLSELFQARTRLTPAGEAYRQFDLRTQKWVSYSWADMQERVRHWRAALRQENLPLGARVAILVPNSIEHVCMDQAALSLGMVPVPLHVVDNPGNLAFVIGDCGASVLLVDSWARWSALAPFGDQFGELNCVLVLEEGALAGGHEGDRNDSGAGTRVASITTWLSRAKPDTETDDPESPIDPNALAAIVYTSGTTGRPKGVMLSHQNILSNVEAILQTMEIRDGDILLSFLPLSHTLERTVGYYLAIASGATVAFARSVAQLMDDLKTIRPTLLISVPRVYERAHAVLRETIDRRLVTKWLFAGAVSLGWRQFQHAQGRGPKLPLLLRPVWRLLDHLVGRPVRDRFGGRLRAAVTGGAAVSSDVARPLLALGIPLVQGYGMTESSPVIATNTLGDNDPSTVGHPIQGAEVRIGDKDELLARSASVMLGYWHRPEESQRMVDADGWLHTGDQAEIINGRIRIKGRIKDIIVTSTGEKVSPADLEAAIANDPLFEQVMVLGEQRPYIGAVLVLNRLRWSSQAVELGLDPQSLSSLQSEVAKQWALQRVAQLVRSFPSYATPRAVFLSLEPWTVASGLITPTLKPKRPAIMSFYEKEIAALYAGH